MGSPHPISSPRQYGSYPIVWLASIAFVAGLLLYFLSVPLISEDTSYLTNRYDQTGGTRAYVFSPRQSGWRLGWMTAGADASSAILSDPRYEALPSIAVPGYCEASAGHASPNGRWVAIQVNCEAGGYVQGYP